jgi:macrolide-specific efflux system membrane fusion protein
MRIADLSTMTVWTQVSEADVPKLRVGMDAYFTTLGSPNRRWEGKLAQILPTPTVVNNVVLYTALFDVANPQGRLMPQMTAQVFFLAGAARDVVTVPVAALHYGGPRGTGGPRTGNRGGQRRDRGQGERRSRPATVTVVSASGAQETRAVRVGVANRISAEIVSGLEEGERVVAGTRQDESETARPQQNRGRGRFGRL